VRLRRPFFSILRTLLLVVAAVHLRGETLISLALAEIKKQGAGIVVYLREGAAGVQPAPHGTRGAKSEKPTASESKRERMWRDVGIGAQILKDLGLQSITLLSPHKLDYVGLAGFDIKIAATQIIGDDAR